MCDLECIGCLKNPPKLNALQSLALTNNQSSSTVNASMKLEESLPTLGSTRQVKNSDDAEPENQLFFRCQCCQSLYCAKCCQKHINSWRQQTLTKSESSEHIEEKQQQILIQTKIASNISIVCQQCQEGNSAKYCQNCGQFLCQKCSFKIHNKGKRAKHTLEDNIVRKMWIKIIVVLGKGFVQSMKESKEEGKTLREIFARVLEKEHKVRLQQAFFMIQDSVQKEFDELDEERWLFDSFEPQGIKYEDLIALKSRYPFVSSCKIFIFSQDSTYPKTLQQQSKSSSTSQIPVQLIFQYKKLSDNSLHPKHERVSSQKIQVKHNKNISNFSNLSAISKVQNQSVLSNEPSDLFQSNQLSLNVTLNQNSSILMMGGSIDVDRDEKEGKEIRQGERKDTKNGGHHRIYSIRQQNSHNSANNVSSSTQNSLRRRTKRWPIPYFQPFRIPKYQRNCPKYNGELYLRDLAQKGILMIRKQKAQQFLNDPQISRHFVRNIGQKQIQYVAYIIDFISVQCLTWVIQSIKQDKMTPNQKLVQSRLKQSFDLKVNMKLWDSIIKYLMSNQYQQDYIDNTPVRYIPKISVVKYGEQYLLQFQQRKWAYQDQQLLDQQQQQWQQFKKLITDYFLDRNQITGGRYGCVQYVKLNGPKPLRKCSLGKLSLFVQEAINKGIIRYHKTLLVSNTMNNSMNQHNNSMNNGNNTSFCSQLGSYDFNGKWVQMQKQLKIMALQLALIDMFMETHPGTPISLAQIPLNLKKSIIFQYTLVELGFPKLKNILNTLTDKLLLQTTKTHISYEITTNGAQAIQKMRRNFFQLSQQFLSQILTQISNIVLHYHTLTLDDVYAQLTVKIGFPFQYKLYHFPDFYQFLLYYCGNFATVQYVGGTLVVYSKFHQYPQIYEQHSQHHSQNNLLQTPPPQHYQQHQNHNYNNQGQNYQLYRSEQYTHNHLKKYNQNHNNYQNNHQNKGPYMSTVLNKNKMTRNQGDQFDHNLHTHTPKFTSNEVLGRDRLGSENWADFLEDDKEKGQFQEDQNQSRQMQHIINILDDGDVSASRPKTVIVNQGPQHQQFFLLPKLDHSPDQLDSFGGEAAVWGQQTVPVNKNSKGQHTRFRSTNEVAAKHSRQYSTANTRK